MITVRKLKIELDKFNDDDLCFAYEGEVTGIVINRGNSQGVIYCGESEGPEKETKIIDE